MWTAEDIDSHITGNRRPRIANPISSQAALAGEAFTFVVASDAFSDPNPSDQLTYSASLVDGSAFPQWLQFDAQTRTFSGVRPSFDSNIYSIRIIATDSAGLSGSEDFDLVTRFNQQIGTNAADTLVGGNVDDVIYMEIGRASCRERV